MEDQVVDAGIPYYGAMSGSDPLPVFAGSQKLRTAPLHHGFALFVFPCQLKHPGFFSPADNGCKQQDRKTHSFDFHGMVPFTGIRSSVRE